MFKSLMRICAKTSITSMFFEFGLGGHCLLNCIRPSILSDKISVSCSMYLKNEFRGREGLLPPELGKIHNILCIFDLILSIFC